MKKLISIAMTILMAITVVSLTGCPDRSHQRAVPDYENMTDGGGEVENEEDEL